MYHLKAWDAVPSALLVRLLNGQRVGGVETTDPRRARRQRTTAPYPMPHRSDHHWFHRIERALMSLSDAVTALTGAVNDAVQEMHALADRVAATGDVDAAEAQIRQLATNLEDAVSQAEATPTTPDAPADPGTGGGTDVPPDTGGDVPPDTGGDVPPTGRR